MSMFDWIPTVGEVFTKVACTFTDHDWNYFVHKGEDIFHGRKYRVCSFCRKSEWV